MTKQPNVVVCMCDQLRASEVGCYGNPVIHTPNIDRLAQEGVRFEHAISNNPVCMPARSCLLSGEYSRTCMGSLGNDVERDAQGRAILPEYPVSRRVHLPDPTLPEQLRSIGYETALIGKWHVKPAPLLVGFDHAVFPRVHHRYTGQTFIEDSGEGEVVDGYSLDYEAERVARYLSTTREKPFFLFYNISPPHMPVDDAPERIRRMYSPAEVPLRPNVFIDGQVAYDENWFKIYLWDFLYYQEHLPHTRRIPEGFDLRHLTALYYGMTTWVDEMVGRLMQGLRVNHLDESTILVFVSDHGDNLGSHHTFNKDTLMEESIRIPLIFHAPGRLSPRLVNTQVAQIVDVMPTLLALCGVAAPTPVQGRNLLPCLTGEQLTVSDGCAYIETSQGQIGVRSPMHLFGLQLDSAHQPLTRHGFFYDLRQDPYEVKNLFGTPEQVEIANTLQASLEVWNQHTPWLKARVAV